MTSPDLLQSRYRRIADACPRVQIATLPTPVLSTTLRRGTASLPVWIKADDRSGDTYGGNKLRKLEYLFGRISPIRFRVVATFGTVASNHALATAIYARQLGFSPVCLLAHQTRTPLARTVLQAHLANGTELVPWGGAYAARTATLRRHLWHRNSAAIPMGGSSWSGCLGFINAALELGAQIEAGDLPCPERIYLATGTLGSSVGLGLGLALAGLGCEVHAVRVSPTDICNETRLGMLATKTLAMLRRVEPQVPESLADRMRIVLRHEFFGPGYARGTTATEAAIAVAGEQAGLDLETTYTGKAMQALLNDLPELSRRGSPVLFWNTCNSRPLQPGSRAGAELPPAFSRYME